MRNGDYRPSRLEAQADAAQLLASAKLQANVENAVAIVAMGGEAYTQPGRQHTDSGAV